MLLGKDDPHPVEVVMPNGKTSGLLVCEHAGRLVPRQLAGLGLPDSVLTQHIAYDIGAEVTARLIGENLQTTLILQRYSRLVIDCNRPPDAPDAMPSISHGTHIPGNSGLDAQQRKSRISEIFEPFDKQIKKQLETSNCQWAFSIHSFTPKLDDTERPWDIGFLFRKDTQTSNKLATAANELYPHLEVGLNEPYQVDEESDWFVPQHAERLGLAHSLIEIRNDHISTPDGQTKWASIVSALIHHVTNHKHE